MNVKQITVGKWYQTKHGIGQCERVGGTFPVTCRFRITAPLPLGVRLLKPAEVQYEVAAAEKGGDA
jgi:hypothetical protein